MQNTICIFLSHIFTSPSYTDVRYIGMTESEMMKYYKGPVWLHSPISYPIDASRYFSMWLDLTTTHRQTWLFSSTSMYHSPDLLTACGVSHLVVHGTSGSTSYEMIPSIRLETSGGVLLTVDDGGATTWRPSPAMWPWWWWYTDLVSDMQQRQHSSY